MTSRLELSLLIDYYGSFLTDNQRELLELSCGDDLSLSEIAEMKGISRQGVRDAISRGEKLLCQMEEKLELIKRDKRAKKIVHDISAKLDGISSGMTGKDLESVAEIKKLLSQLLD